ncbi:MAG: dynamin family protein [Treponema sp.]|nr:dynamin family protein [Treponema sp.]
MDYNLTEKNNELKTDLIHVRNVLNDCESKMSFSTNDELLDNIDSIIEQIDNKTFTVSVIATIKAGKSTFLNALLGNEYLPSSNVPETSNLLFIRNSEETLLQKNKEVIKGITNIKNEIAERNRNDRENGVNIHNKYTLFVPYEKLDSLKNLNFQFVDTPGPNESDVPSLKNEVEKILKVSDVIIYLMDYGKLNSTDESELFSTISTIRKDLLSDIKSKVFFVVNKMDNKNTNSLNEEETINFVKEQLKKQLKIDSPNIYCISAENALLAKMIKNKNYKRIDDIGRKAFGDFGWSDDDTEDIKVSKLTNIILEKFIEKSGVPRLEDKIINFIVSNSESLFYESIVSKVVNIIQEIKNVFSTKKN